MPYYTPRQRPQRRHHAKQQQQSALSLVPTTPRSSQEANRPRRAVPRDLLTGAPIVVPRAQQRWVKGKDWYGPSKDASKAPARTRRDGGALFHDPDPDPEETTATAATQVEAALRQAHGSDDLVTLIEEASKMLYG